MKKIYLILILILPFFSNAQEKLSYNSNNETIEFNISKEHYFLKFNEAKSQYVKQKRSEDYLIFTENYAVIQLEVDKTKKKFSERTSIVKEMYSNNLTEIEPVLIYKDGIKQVCNGEIIIKIIEPNLLNDLLNDYIYSIKNDEYVKNQFLVKIQNISTESLFQLVNTLQKNKNIEFVEPNFIRLLKPLTNDPHYNSQWAINNQGYLGGTVDADMDVDEAWTLVTGQNVKVAIIDEGVDLTHPDLTPNLLPGHDATGFNSNGGPNENNNDAHGTSAAGIVSAVANNTNGIAGVAYNAKIIPIRIAFSNGLPLNDPNRSWITNDTWIANGINWAVQNGADILSNSWGGGSPSTTITNAINNAVYNGRNNKGCIVLFASGNQNTSVSYPATLPNVIAVGASSMCDERKRSTSDGTLLAGSNVSPDPDGTSCDNEWFWGSNFGSEIDVVAPGVNIYSTDISGPLGYRNNDYIADFNGTSSACPNAAGVAALILSTNLNQTQSQVRNILETSTDKISSYNYSTTSGHPNGTWNNEVGYGRINAYKAVATALSTGINGPDEICTGQQSIYSLINSVPTGATITWQYPTNKMYIVSGQGTASCTFNAFTGGSGNIIKAIVDYNGNQDIYQIVVKIISGGSNPSTPTIAIAPDNPANLYCCGQTQTFNHTVCTNNCTNIEWDFNVQYQDPQDIYAFATTGNAGYIVAQKNTYSPLIVGARARNLPVNCGNPSSWTSYITRYYGTVSSGSRMASTNTSNYNSELPLNEYFAVNENNLYIETVYLYDWLYDQYSNKNLDEKQVDKILNFIQNEKSFENVKVQIFNLYGTKVFENNFEQGNHVVNLSHLKDGVYVVKYDYGNMTSSKKIIKEG